MNISRPFIFRPVATTLLTIAVAMGGGLAYFFLPISALPQVDYPAISVGAALPGASPETMASSVATPLERQFGRIAGLVEMSSTSNLGTCGVSMTFDLSRDIDAAARDVQAAINASLGNLPSNLPGLPSYRKSNPSEAPILILALTSDLYDRPAMYDAASTILEQKMSQLDGIGQVLPVGSALPGVRVEVDPLRLNTLGLGLEDVRTTLAAADANRPKGQFSDANTTHTISTTDQLFKASEYKPLIIAYRNGAPVRISDVADAVDSVEDLRQAGYYNGKPSVLLIIFRQPGANIIDAVDNVLAAMPRLKAEIPAGMDLGIVMDRTTTIRASVHDTQITLLISIGLVILVVFLFLRTVRSTLIPSVAVPVSLVGTFGVMYLCGYSLDNLSLMALTIATGFVVDDAIVVVENITRHMEGGMEPMEAALLGAQEIGFTVLSMSTSLVAVFIPILMMPGLIGRLFREFGVVLSVAIGVSLLVSLTTTPMMCATLFKSRLQQRHGHVYRLSEAGFDWLLGRYRAMLTVVLRHRLITAIITLLTMGLSIYLYWKIPNDFFPQQDVGRLQGQLRADQNISFQAMDKMMRQYVEAVSKDPAVDNVVAFTGGGRSANNVATVFTALKPLSQRQLSAGEIIKRLAKETAVIPGGNLVFQAQQELKVGARMSAAQYQYTLQGEDLDELNQWGPRVLERLKLLKKPKLSSLISDQQNGGLAEYVTYDRDTAMRLGLSPQNIDNTLYDAFGQRQVNTMYTVLNQYHVVMEADQSYWKSPEGLDSIYVANASGVQVPLSVIAKWVGSNTALAVAHTGQFPSVTISFNLDPGVALSDAVTEIEDTMRDIGLPASIHGVFQGTAQAYQEIKAKEPILILAAIFAIYIVLGILYESYIHPITILSTIPSAGVGALLALMVCGIPLTVISFIGIILLIGIVKKNAIMMIDFALVAEREEGKTTEEAIFQACLLRFRPIMMTTMAALLGGLPLALGSGTGSEMRRPLGVAIVGGLIFSQLLTLFTTPVIYLYMDRFRLWLGEVKTLANVQGK